MYATICDISQCAHSIYFYKNKRLMFLMINSHHLIWLSTFITPIRYSYFEIDQYFWFTTKYNKLTKLTHLEKSTVYIYFYFLDCLLRISSLTCFCSVTDDSEYLLEGCSLHGCTLYSRSTEASRSPGPQELC